MHAAGIMGTHSVIRTLKAVAQYPIVYMSLIFHLKPNPLGDFSSIDDDSSSTAQAAGLTMGHSKYLIERYEHWYCGPSTAPLWDLAVTSSISWLCTREPDLQLSNIMAIASAYSVLEDIASSIRTNLDTLQPEKTQNPFPVRNHRS